MSTVTRERLAEIKARYTAASDATCPDVPDLVETLEWYIAVAGALGESQERLAKEPREARDVSEDRREEAFAWTSAYFEEQRKRDEACAEVERLKAELKQVRETVLKVRALTTEETAWETFPGMAAKYLREIHELTTEAVKHGNG